MLVGQRERKRPPGVFVTKVVDTEVNEELLNTILVLG
jgi:hypothetical protein